MKEWRVGNIDFTNSKGESVIEERVRERSHLRTYGGSGVKKF